MKLSLAMLLLVLGSCASTRGRLDMDSIGRRDLPEVGDEIVICGQRYSIGAPVVLWTDPDGYDAYQTDFHFGSPPRSVKKPPRVGKLRYTPGRETRSEGVTVLFPAGSNDIDALGEVVDQFVLHYDVAGLSRSCFKVLHDRRGLSVHFMLDIDGTIYQTLDLRDQAWHAAKANPRSIGIEIANMGAWQLSKVAELETWYSRDWKGTRIRIPAWVEESGVRTLGFVGRPARDERIRARIQGEVREQYDFTPEQYDSLVKLTAALCQIFPNLEPTVPRDARGRVRTTVMSDAEWRAYSGILGHLHVSKHKQDPGPAFEWESFLVRVQMRLMSSGT